MEGAIFLVTRLQECAWWRYPSLIFYWSTDLFSLLCKKETSTSSAGDADTNTSSTSDIGVCGANIQMICMVIPRGIYVPFVGEKVF